MTSTAVYNSICLLKNVTALSPIFLHTEEHEHLHSKVEVKKNSAVDLRSQDEAGENRI